MACLTVVAAVWAGPVSEGQAISVAREFVAKHSMSTAGLEMVKKTTRLNSSQPAYYVFNVQRADSGFIIVSGDDRAPAVLGYSDCGTFDANDVPAALAEMLDSYVEQIAALDLGVAPRQGVMSRPAIAPMVPSNWAQGNPYNIKLPFVGSKHASTGCVATAMAQVMYYWKWPAAPTMTIPAYTSESLNINMPALAPVNFSWDKMQNNYYTNDTLSEAANAVATLMLYCAQSVEMDFKESSSGASTTYTPVAFASYFGYEPSVHAIKRSNYTTQEWEDAIYAELQAARPVIFSGSKSPGGHAFVCDGCDNDGLFHINWGWNSQSNGYFLLNVLNPQLQGTGSAAGAHGYIFDNAAIVGIRPGNSTSSEVMMTVMNQTLDSFTRTRSTTNQDFSAVVTARFYNLTSSVMAVDFGWGLYDENGNRVENLYTTYSNSSTPSRYYTLSNITLSFGAGMTSGTYRIVPICRQRGVGAAWHPCAGAENNYIEVVINNYNCTFTAYGSAATPNYTVNNITMEGNKHPNRPMNITLNMTNNSESVSNMLYMFVGSTSTPTMAGVVSLGNGETGDVHFRYVPTAAGNYTIKFSFNEDGSNPIATRTLTITEMPAANLSGTAQVLNETGSVINSDKFSVLLNITNNGSQTYREDISFTLYKNTYANYGNAVQSKVQYIELAPGATTTVQFDMDNVVDGWRYFARAYYYSAGAETNLVNISFHTIVFPEVPAFKRGDVDGNGNVDMDDLTALINYLLDSSSPINYAAAAACNEMNDDVVSMDDLTAMINYLLTNVW